MSTHLIRAVACLVVVLNATGALAIDCNLWIDCGNIGIGTVAPLRQLHVKSGLPSQTNYLLRLDSPTGVNTGQFIETTLNTQFGAVNDAASTYSFQIRNGTAAKLYVGTAGTYDGRVGIGTTTPGAPLEIEQSSGGGGSDNTVIMVDAGETIPSSQLINFADYGTSAGAYRDAWENNGFVVKQPGQGPALFVGTQGSYAGDVGIGTFPGARLHVYGVGQNPAQDMVLLDGGGISRETIQATAVEFGAKRIGTDWGFHVASDLGSGNGSFYVGTTGPYAGNVGVGTTTPSNKLEVAGTVECKELRVTLSAGLPDYVFDDSYELMPLSDVDAYVKEHRRLPGLPSAATVAEEGIGVGELQALLLEKIEELTLHMIELGKANVAMRAELDALR